MHPFDLAFEHIKDRSHQRIFHHFFRRGSTKRRSGLCAFGWGFI